MRTATGCFLFLLFTFPGYSQIISNNYCGYWNVTAAEKITYHSSYGFEKPYTILVENLKVSILGRNSTFLFNQDFDDYRMDEPYCWELPSDCPPPPPYCRPFHWPERQSISPAPACCPVHIVYADDYTVVVTVRDPSPSGFAAGLYRFTLERDHD